MKLQKYDTLRGERNELVLFDNDDVQVSLRPEFYREFVLYNFLDIGNEIWLQIQFGFFRILIDLREHMV